MLVGRDAELGRIDELVASLSSGAGSVALLEGPAGIGKTALVTWAARRAGLAEVAVLRAVGGPLERGYPFGVVRQLFAASVAPDRAPSDLLEGAAGLAALPLGLIGVGGPSSAWVDPAAAAMHGLYWLTSRLAERSPLLLMIDDAHWADEASLSFLLYLARRLDDVPVAVLVAARPDAEPGSRELLAQLGELPGLATWRLAPLSRRDVGQLLSDGGIGGAGEPIVSACHEASGGNPFLVGELIAGLRAGEVRGADADPARVAALAPRRVIQWVSARLTALGEPATRLAGAIAVLGIDALLADAGVVAGLEPGVATSAADRLVRADILSGAQAYQFAHPLIRAAVYDGLSPAERSAMHAHAARVVAAHESSLAPVAVHLLACDPAHDGWAVKILRAAAGEASASGAAAAAVSYLERALRERVTRVARCELLLELADAREQAGVPGAARLMQEALTYTDESHRRGEICLKLGRALFSAGDYGPAREWFKRGLDEIPRDEDDLFLELRCWYGTDTNAVLPKLTAPAAIRLRDLIDGGAPAHTRTDRLVLAHFAYQTARSGERPYQQVASAARRALADGELLEDSGRDMGPYSAACVALMTAVDPAAAIAELTRGIELSQRHGSLTSFAWFSHLRGIAHYARGALPEAIADLESARTAYTEKCGRPLPDTQAVLAICRLERDDLAGAAEALTAGDDGRLSEPDPQSPSPSQSFAYALGRVLAAQGRLRDGLTALSSCDGWARQMGASNPAASLPWRADAALLVLRLDERDRARELVAENLELAERFGAPGALGIALRSAGLIAGGESGLAHLAAAVSLLEGAGIELELALALVEQGAAIRRTGRRAGAIDPLRRGCDLAARCGAHALTRRARAELVAAGARPRRDRVWGADSLTASELRVARMAAEGMSNPQIAQGLFITRKTVTIHLTRAYRKLDITSRAQLAQSLGPHSVDPAGRQLV